MKVRTSTVALAIVVATTLHAQQHAPQTDSIRKDDLRADLFFLAGDQMRGRLTAMPENALAAEFIKARFERLGLKPAVDGSYFQPYNLVTTTLGPSNQIEISWANDANWRPVSGQDFYPQRFSANAHARGSLVFAGFGILSPDRSYDDYQGAEIKGKVVLVLDHEPGERDPNSPFDGVVTSEPSTAWRKALEAAQQKGAVGILFVQDVHNHPGTANFEAAATATWPDLQPRIRNFTDGLHVRANAGRAGREGERDLRS